MKIIDSTITDRVKRLPDYKQVILSHPYTSHGVIISGISLHLYKEGHDDTLGDYSLITAVVSTDKGIVELLYDQGYRGDSPLSDAAALLTENLGLSSLILRSIISLES